ncbi:hypothetical protein ACCS78_37900, partial [Rhizobium johnstonii]
MARAGIEMGHHQQALDRIANCVAIRLDQPQIAECLQVEHDPSSAVHNRILQLTVAVRQSRDKVDRGVDQGATGRSGAAIAAGIAG